MKSFLTLILSIFLNCYLCAGTGLTPADAEKAIADATQPAVPDKPHDDHSLVSVLGYHDFTDGKNATEMMLPIEDFRAQMQAIKDLNLRVITLEEFLAWKKGTLQLPERSVLITIDDGWKNVYTLAYPVLKEYQFPFTLFLYKNYVDGGGRALTTKMVKEMQENGASIGSHSVSHPYPATVKSHKAKGPEHFAEFLENEFGTSKTFLEEKFSKPVTTYAYPGGFHTEEMHTIAQAHGYQCLFTVLPGKVEKTSDDLALPRYVVLGTHPSIFESATRFPATLNSTASLGAIVQTTPHPVTPAAGATTNNRLPEISADLSAVENLDPASLVMRVSGFGKVPATFDPETKKFSWKVNRRLRKPTCDIAVSWKLLEATDYEKPMLWTFILDHRASYMPKTAPSLPPAHHDDPTAE